MGFFLHSSYFIYPCWSNKKIQLVGGFVPRVWNRMIVNLVLILHKKSIENVKNLWSHHRFVTIPSFFEATSSIQLHSKETQRLPQWKHPVEIKKHPVEKTPNKKHPLSSQTCDHAPADVSVALWDLAPRSPGIDWWKCQVALVSWA